MRNVTTREPGATSLEIYTRPEMTQAREWNLKRAIGRIITEEVDRNTAGAARVKVETSEVRLELRGPADGVRGPADGDWDGTWPAAREMLATEVAESCGATVSIEENDDATETAWTITLASGWRGQIKNLADALRYSPIDIEAYGLPRKRSEFPGHQIIGQKTIGNDTYYLCRGPGRHARRNGIGSVLAGMQQISDDDLPVVQGQDPRTGEATAVGVMIRTGPGNRLNEPKGGMASKLDRETTRIEMARHAQEFAAAEIERAAAEPGGFLTLSWRSLQEVRSWGAEIPESPWPLRAWTPSQPDPGGRNGGPKYRLTENRLAVIDNETLETSEAETLARALDIEAGRPGVPRLIVGEAEPALAGYASYDSLPRVTGIRMLNETTENVLAVEVTCVKQGPDGRKTTDTVTLETDVLLPVRTGDLEGRRSRPLYGAVIDRNRLTATADEIARMLASAYPEGPKYDDETAFDAGVARFAEDDDRELLRKTAAEIHGVDPARLLLIEDAIRRHAGNDVPEDRPVRVTIARGAKGLEVHAEYDGGEPAAS